MTSDGIHALGLKLGRRTDADGLDPVPRALSRAGLNLPAFHGEDLWNCWETGFLLESGLPQVWHMQCHYGADSPNIIESKSFKLFLNARNNEHFADVDDFAERIRGPLEACAGAAVSLVFHAPERSPTPRRARGDCVDTLTFAGVDSAYRPDVLIRADAEPGDWALHSHLLRSRCPVTGQPDWGTVEVQGRGARPTPEAFLAYVVGLREHQDFHEACCERIFSDIHERLSPDALTVRCAYTRRGGLDINPVRSTQSIAASDPAPLWRQ
ncbi:MAG: NADPH-dependent 7-cyano-7-deazaguanine reductase QueF [Gammaproteobacteria bacterium]